jgi:hypothetical protein
MLYNVTVVGPPDPTGTSEAIAGVNLYGGTAGLIRSALFYSMPYTTHRVLDIDDAFTWSQFLSGNLGIEESLIVGFGRLGDGDDDFVGGVPYLSPGVEDQYLRDTLANGNMIVPDFGVADSLLLGPFTVVSDFRPRLTSGPLLSACAGAPAGDSFFEPTSFCGATADQWDAIPWYEPAPLRDMTGTPVSPQPAYLTLTLRTAEESAPIAGIRVNGVSSGGTDVGGRYRSYVSPNGAVLSYSIPDSIINLYGLCVPSFEVITEGFAERAMVNVVSEIPDCPGSQD